MNTKFWLGNLKGRYHLEDVDVQGPFKKFVD
jgi:hypothetical protein